MKASFTLESSFIYPAVILISVLLIMYSFFVHDKIVIRSDTYRVLMENYYRHDEDADEYDISERLSEKCMLNHSLSLQYDNNSDTLIASEAGLQKWNSLSVKVSFTGYERCDFIRQYYTIINYIDKKLGKDQTE